MRPYLYKSSSYLFSDVRENRWIYVWRIIWGPRKKRVVSKIMLYRTVIFRRSSIFPSDNNCQLFEDVGEEPWGWWDSKWKWFELEHFFSYVDSWEFPGRWLDWNMEISILEIYGDLEDGWIGMWKEVSLRSMLNTYIPCSGVKDLLLVLDLLSFWETKILEH